ncbi:MFS general substrate transporter [Bimuria novae-zelandiae CBS 107.79]|uniref:MFS general substrate transporter n=1 Tax=Bimuria novae-zelandiae CBS 107.79 TaxID=1447943 RepID=A0A6A5V2N7_9PLEO|nr:MFS general substrate transporter [Bimuria novae-zelandiae CBS 107.79]
MLPENLVRTTFFGQVVRGKSIVLVGWYGPDDPEIFVLNFGIYIGSSIYVPGEPDIMADFGVSETVATLGLSLYTVGYGLGPMLWSPLSEIPSIVRFAPNIATLLVFRILTGFFGSPYLATGGGTIADMYAPMEILFYICMWSSFAPVKGWSWTIWIFAVAMFLLLPETSAANILHRRAKRLRRLAGNDRFKSQSEIDAANHTTKDHLIVLARTFTLTFDEPVVLLMDLYTGLLYGVLFIWFDSFPIVFGEIYGFDSGEQGLDFLGIFVGLIITAPLLLIWILVKIAPVITSPWFKPEMLLPPAFAGCLAFPVCLFWYGWSARESVHWIMPIIGTSFFGMGIVTLFNSVFNYLAMSYPCETASFFAGNALFRAAFGASFPLFARTFFGKLDIGAGNSLLGGVATCFIPITFVLYRYEGKNRHISKNARHDV